MLKGCSFLARSQRGRRGLPVEAGQGPGGRGVQEGEAPSRKTIFTILRFLWRAQYYAVEQITSIQSPPAPLSCTCAPPRQPPHPNPPPYNLLCLSQYADDDVVWRKYLSLSLELAVKRYTNSLNQNRRLGHQLGFNVSNQKIKVIIFSRRRNLVKTI